MAVPKYPFPVVGGLERQAYELAKALTMRGHTVHGVSSRFDPIQNEVDMIDHVRVHRVKWVEFRPARFLLFPLSLGRILLRNRRNIDLVHVHNISWFSFFVTLFAKALGLPVITKLPSIGQFGVPSLRGLPFGFLRIAVFKSCDAIIAMTPESMEELIAIGYPLARVLRVTNGIPMLSPSMAASQPRSSGAVTAVFVGRLSSEKNVADLLHAWAAVKACVSIAVRLRIVGDGPQEKELKTLSEALGIDDTVEFTGYCSNVPAELAKADLFVLTSASEGNSNAILEAMRAGLPIVATHVGGAALQVGAEGERFLVPPGDHCTLTARLLELIANEPLRARIGAAMRARIQNIFTIDLIAATYEQAYRLILAGEREQIGQINPVLFGSNETDSINYSG
jgi:glycosyltransferase involved in cell wall biosynthesis